MVEHIDFYRERRARPGFGARKQYLLELFRQYESEITHHIIAGCASGTHEAKTHFIERRATVERQRDAVALELMDITKD